MLLVVQIQFTRELLGMENMPPKIRLLLELANYSFLLYFSVYNFVDAVIESLTQGIYQQSRKKMKTKM